MITHVTSYVATNFRYGTIESNYLEERQHEERVLYTNEMTKNRDVHFITQPEIDSFKTALRIQIKQVHAAGVLTTIQLVVDPLSVPQM